MQLAARTRTWLARIVLALIVITGAALRLYNVNWDSGQLIHPDERWIVMVEGTLGAPDNLLQALDPERSPLNPYHLPPTPDRPEGEERRFAYGHFPLYLLHFLAGVLTQLAPLAARFPRDSGPAEALRSLAQITDYSRINLLGRILSALFDTGTIIFIYLLGKRLYGQWAGLLAAAFLAITVLHIQLAHFYAFDVVMAFFVVAALYFDVRIAQGGTRGDTILAGLCTGLAIGSKFSALPAVLPLGVAHALRALAVEKEMAPQASDPQSLAGSAQLTLFLKEPLSLAERALPGFVVSLAAAFLAFAVTNPFALLDFQGFQSSISYENEMARGLSDLPYTRQYQRTTPYLYHIGNQLQWGMGWLLGIAGFSGLGWAIYRLLRRRSTLGEVIVLSWVVPYFLVTGSFMVKYVRYMVLVVPFLCICGAGMLLALDKRRGSSFLSRPLLTRAAIAIILIGTALWAYAFMQIYTTPLTRVRASEWIYNNIPRGSGLTAEEWDDRLPFDMKVGDVQRNSSEYHIVKMALQEPDDANKVAMITQALRAADYVIISSNRFYGWLPRLGDRFPITNRYYDLLFAGELGFKQIEAFTSYPRIFGIVFNDDQADESFTVYDHPKVLIFAKSRQLSAEELRALLPAPAGTRPVPEAQQRVSAAEGGTQAQVEPGPGQATGEGAPQRPPGKSLLLDQPVDKLPIVDDYHWNTLANTHHGLAVLVWWIVVEIIGLLAWPLTAVVMSQLKDKGYGLAKSLGLLVIGYPVWLGASLRLWSNTLPFILGAAALLGIISALLLWQDLRRPASARIGILALWRQGWPLLLLSEALFTTAFLGFVGLRMLNPDLWQPWNGGEKMMESGFLNAILKSAYLPPYDPYFAGGYINYYYYGYFLVGLLVKLAGVQPSIAFNLAVPTLAALTVAGAFSIGYNLGGIELRPSPASLAAPMMAQAQAFSPIQLDLQRLSVGFLAAIFVTALGNLDGCGQFLQRLQELGGSDFESLIPGLQGAVRSLPGLLKVLSGEPLPAYNYWDPTRVIPNTINEFPYFSFIFADLHPHMMNIPFTLLLIGLALNLLLREGPGIPKAQNLTAEMAEGAAVSDEIVPPQRSPWPAACTCRHSERSGGCGAGTGGARRGGLRALRLKIGTLYSAGPLLSWAFLPFCLGALAIVNTWDMPTYLGLVSAAFLLRGFRATGRLPLVSTVVFGGITAAISLALYYPFFHAYQAVDVGLGLVRDKTPLDKYLSIWGFFLFILFSFLLMALVQWRWRWPFLRLIGLILRRWRIMPRWSTLHQALVRPSAGYLTGCYALGGLAFLTFILAALGFSVPAFLVIPLVAALVLLLGQGEGAERTFALLLTFTGLLILLGCEFFFLRDWLGGGPDYRMNTIFKFYIQVWVMFGLAAAASLPALWEWVSCWRSPFWRFGWQVAFTALLGAVLVYTVLGTRARVEDRFPNRTPPLGTLDGLAYMTVGQFDWPPGNTIQLKYDYEAIRWLLANVRGTPVVAEASIGYYREGGMRVSSYTGFPMPLGGLHQNEQRPPWQIGERDGLVREFWNTPDVGRGLQLMRELNISYIYVGQLERVTYPPEGLAKFDQMAAQGYLHIPFRNERVVIYRLSSTV
jgi:uncharacterized membrane protein